MTRRVDLGLPGMCEPVLMNFLALFRCGFSAERSSHLNVEIERLGAKRSSPYM